MHAAIHSPLAAGIALVGASAIAATPIAAPPTSIAAPPPVIHISDVRLTLSAQAIQVNPVALGVRLVGQTTGDALTQAGRVATLPIARALVLNVSRALGGGAVRYVTATDLGTTPAVMERRGGGVLGTVQNVVVDVVGTTVRLVPATIGAGLGVAASTINAVVQTGVTTTRALLNVGAAALTLNPGAVVNAAALGAVRVAGTIEQTTIGVPRKSDSPQPETKATISAPPLRTRTPSILTSILNGRDEIANAIFPSRVKTQAVTAGASRTALTAKAATEPQGTTTSVAKTTATSTDTESDTAKSTDTESNSAKSTTGAKHAAE